MDTITLKEVLENMDSGAHFSIAFVTADTEKKTGGEWKEINHAWKSHSGGNKYDKRKAPQPKSVSLKNPNHYDNSTRNLVLPNHEIRKVHIRLMRKYNGKTII